MLTQLPVEHPVSAGGVVYRRRENAVEVVLCGRKDPPTWNLPKGTPDLGESLVDTARREVEEETGLKVHVLGRIGLIRYRFVRDGVRYHKTVHFYLMEPVGGALEEHDPEFDMVEWFPVAEACLRLTFDNEVRIVRRAAAMVKKELGAELAAGGRR